MTPLNEPERTRFVFAYTNKDVDRLNAELRQVRVERGELGRDHRFETKTACTPSRWAIACSSRIP